MPPFPSSFSSIFIVLRKEELIYEKGLHWLDDCLEKILLFLALAAMAVIMGIQVFCRSVLFMSLSWSEELTRCLFIWSGFLSVQLLHQILHFHQDRTGCGKTFPA